MSGSCRHQSAPPEADREGISSKDLGIGRYLFLSRVVIAVLVLGLGGWAALASITGAVIASGSLTVISNSKTIQHLTGGIVSDIAVKEGDAVKAGDLIMRLDATLPKANLAIITKQMDELLARQGRLEAEREGHDVIRYPPALAKRRDDPQVRVVMMGQAKLFRARTQAMEGQRKQLRQRVSQLRDEITGLEAQRKAKADEISMIGDELTGLEKLRAKGLVPKTRLVSLRRQAARLNGEEGSLIAAKARAQGRIAETEVQIIQLTRDRQAQVVSELRQVHLKISELIERRIAAEDQLRRVEIRAPIAGRIHDLEIHTIGGVVQGGKEIVKIIPSKDELIVEARLEPKDIDQVREGQTSSIRLSSFNQRKTPELTGTVSHVSADLMRDDKRQRTFYKVRIRFDAGEIDRLEGKELIPGMPADVFIQTGSKTALSYLIEPLTDQLGRAFREE